MIELNKIYCENCLDTMARMLDGFVDLTVTSPPYDSLRNYNGYSFEFEKIAKELFRVTKQGGVVVWVVGDKTENGCESLTSFKQAIYFVECGFNLWDSMVWRKPNPTPIDSRIGRYVPSWEFMFVLSKELPKTKNMLREKSIRAGEIASTPTSGQRNEDGSKRLDRIEKRRGVPIAEFKVKSNVFDYAVGIERNLGHPAPFPEALARDHIYSWSNEGDLVYDPFMGSGTTAKMAHLMKRNWIGSEISQEYVDLANKRLRKYLDQADLFQLEKTNGKSHGEQSDIFTRIVLDGRNGKSELKNEDVILESKI